jgi:hypothetical protein
MLLRGREGLGCGVVFVLRAWLALLLLFVLCSCTSRIAIFLTGTLVQFPCVMVNHGWGWCPEVSS